MLFLKQIRLWFRHNQFSVSFLFMLIKATVDHTTCYGSLRLGGMKWSVSIYWKISCSLQQILPSSALFAKQFEVLESRFYHHTQVLNKTNKSLLWWVNIFYSTGAVTVIAVDVSRANYQLRFSSLIYGLRHCV